MMFRPIQIIFLLLFKIILKRLPMFKFITKYLSLPISSISFGVFYKVFKILFSTSSALIMSVVFLPLFIVLYSIRHLIIRNLDISQLSILKPNLNLYVSSIIINLVTPYWNTCLKYSKSFKLLYSIILFTTSVGFIKPIIKFTYFIFRLI